MKYSLLMALVILFSQSSFANQITITKKCSLSKSMMPLCYHKREKAEFKIALIYYGDHWNVGDLDRLAPLLEKRFNLATNNKIVLKILSKMAFTYRQKMPKNYSYNNIKDPARLQRIFYSKKVGYKVLAEVYEEYKNRADMKLVDKLDAIIAVTGAQFEGLGFASGRISVTEHPREIAWALPGGGRVEYVTDYRIVDELIHEIGHNMFMGHTSTQCQKPGMTLEEKLKCCEESPSKNDALSYCRKRADVNVNFMHGFETCNQNKIEKLVVPTLLRGGKWRINNKIRCR